MKIKIKLLLQTMAFLVVAFFINSCGTLSTSPESNDSDIPWNAPESWELSPSIPGMSGNNEP